MKSVPKLRLFAIFAVIITFSLAGCSNGAGGNGAGGGDNGPDAVIAVSCGGGVTMTMNRINAGSFHMGDPSGGDMSSAQPQQSVTLTKEFYMGIHQVTQEQWTAVMTGSDNNLDPSEFTSGAAGGEVQVKRPVENITWFDAIEFCNRLSDRAGLESVYTITGITRNTDGQITAATVTAEWSKNGFRLPTEAEWEYACRAGTTTEWSFGNTDATLGNYAWYDDNSDDKTHQVGKKTANSWGLFDMHGNVWEWCWDLYSAYDNPPVSKTDPRGPASGIGRVMRGASWNDPAEDTRSAHRHNIGPVFCNYDLGFRVVR